MFNYLKRGEFIVKAGKTESSAGRPSRIYRLRADLWYSIGVFLLPDSFIVVAVDGGKNIVFEKIFSLRLSADPQDHTQNIVEDLTLGHILDAAREGDRLARITLRKIGSYLGKACGAALTAFDRSLCERLAGEVGVESYAD